MERANVWRGVMEPDSALNEFRILATDLCWWCGDVATTEEHRIKASTLRRVGKADDGTSRPSNVFKKASDFEGTLRTLRTGSQVRWRRNMCADCNNSRSQPFDLAYDVFESFLVSQFEVMADWTYLDWQEVYGDDWQVGARNLARYFGKQLGCMLATYDLPVPDDVRAFLNGADRCPSVCYRLEINPAVIALMHSEHAANDLSKFVGLLEAPAYSSDDSLTGTDYGYHIGYLNFLACWRADENFSSWFEDKICELQRFTTER